MSEGENKEGFVPKQKSGISRRNAIKVSAGIVAGVAMTTVASKERQTAKEGIETVKYPIL